MVRHLIVRMSCCIGKQNLVFAVRLILSIRTSTC